jgi:large subunit ribosomal protein L29
MKSSEFMKSVRGMTSAQLKEELAALRREQFNLRMQAAVGQQAKSHLVSEVRKKIARIKTAINEANVKQAKAS